nr:MAG TPA: hypothetical protein [Caudoviricetes sp.]
MRFPIDSKASYLLLILVYHKNMILSRIIFKKQ